MRGAGRSVATHLLGRRTGCQIMASAFKKLEAEAVDDADGHAETAAGVVRLIVPDPSVVIGRGRGSD
jgi:hypothetical protein